MTQPQPFDLGSNIQSVLAANPNLAATPELAVGVAQSPDPYGTAEVVSHAANMNTAQQVSQQHAQTSSAGHAGFWGTLGHLAHVAVRDAESGIGTALSTVAGAAGGALTELGRPLGDVQHNYRYLRAVYDRHGPIAGTLELLGMAAGGVAGGLVGAVGGPVGMYEGSKLGSEGVASAEQRLFYHQTSLDTAKAYTDKAGNDVSFGRDLAHVANWVSGGHVQNDPGKLDAFDIISGIGDASFDVGADPLLAAGKAKKAVDLGGQNAGIARLLGGDSTAIGRRLSTGRMIAPTDTAEDVLRVYQNRPEVARAFDSLAKMSAGDIATRLPKLAPLASELGAATTPNEVASVFHQAATIGEYGFSSSGLPKTGITRGVLSRLNNGIYDRMTTPVLDEAGNVKTSGTVLDEAGNVIDEGGAPLMGLNRAGRAYNMFQAYRPFAYDPNLRKLDTKSFDPNNAMALNAIARVMRYSQSPAVVAKVMDKYLADGGDVATRAAVYKNAVIDMMRAGGLSDTHPILKQMRGEMDKIGVGGEADVYALDKMGLDLSKYERPDGSSIQAGVFVNQQGRLSFPNFQAIRNVLRDDGGAAISALGKADQFVASNYMSRVFKPLALLSLGFAQRVSLAELLPGSLALGARKVLGTSLLNNGRKLAPEDYAREVEAHATALGDGKTSLEQNPGREMPLTAGVPKYDTSGIPLIEGHGEVTAPPAFEGGPALYHGTAQPWRGGQIDPSGMTGKAALNLFGPGLYTTDSRNVAEKYTGKELQAGVLHDRLTEHFPAERYPLVPEARLREFGEMSRQELERLSTYSDNASSPYNVMTRWHMKGNRAGDYSDAPEDVQRAAQELEVIQQMARRPSGAYAAPKRPVVYSLQHTGSGVPNFLDLDKPVDDPRVLNAFHQAIDRHADLDPAELRGKTGVELYGMLRAHLADDMMPVYEADEVTTDLMHTLQDLGYDGFKHVGGSFVSKAGEAHNVHVFFDPSALRARQMGVPEAFAPSTIPVLGRSGESAFIPHIAVRAITHDEVNSVAAATPGATLLDGEHEHVAATAAKTLFDSVWGKPVLKAGTGQIGKGMMRLSSALLDDDYRRVLLNLTVRHGSHVVDPALMTGEHGLMHDSDGATQLAASIYHTGSSAPPKFQVGDGFTGYKTSDAKHPAMWSAALKEPAGDAGARVMARTILNHDDMSAGRLAAEDAHDRWLEQIRAGTDPTSLRYQGLIRVRENDPLYAQKKYDAIMGLVTGEDGTVNRNLLENIAAGQGTDLKTLRNIPLEQRPAMVKGPTLNNIGQPAAFDRLVAQGFRPLEGIINHISREPLYVASVTKEYKYLKPLVDAGTLAEDDAMRMAEQRAVPNMLPMIHNVELRNQFSDTFRNVMPFYFAQEQAARRYGSVILSDPAAAAKLLLVHHLIADTGIVRSDPSDPSQRYVVIPGGGPAAEWLAKGFAATGLMGVQGGIPTQFSGNLQSLKTVVPEGNLPSLSPVISVPLKMIEQRFPEAADVISPVIGPIAESSPSVWSQILPSGSIRNLLTGLQGSPQSASFTTAYAYAAANALRTGKLREDMTPPQQEMELARIRNTARIYFIAKGLLAAISPLSPKMDVGDLPLRQELTNTIKAQGGDFAKGMDVFLRAHPDAVPSTVFQSESKVGGALPPSTAETTRFLSDHKDLVYNYSYAAPFFIPQGVKGNYDATAQNMELSLGLRQRKTTERFVQTVFIAQGASEYFDKEHQYQSALKDLQDAGNTDGARALTAGWQSWASGFKAQHPAFATDLGSQTGARTVDGVQALREMGDIFDKGLAPASPQTDLIKTLYDQYGQYAQAYKQAKAAGDRTTTAALYNGWQAHLDQYAVDNPAAKQVVRTVFARLPRPVPDLEANPS